MSQMKAGMNAWLASLDKQVSKMGHKNLAVVLGWTEWARVDGLVEQPSDTGSKELAGALGCAKQAKLDGPDEKAGKAGCD